jgi:hypothetical protein
VGVGLGVAEVASEQPPIAAIAKPATSLDRYANGDLPSA